METKWPWKIKSSEVTYKNPWILVQEDQVVRPDWKDGIFWVVTIVPGVSVLPIDKEWNVYVTKEFHYAINSYWIESVSWAIDVGEEPLDAAKRELKEETGITAQKWTSLWIVEPLTTILSSPAELFLAEDLEFWDAEQEWTEKIEVLRIPFSDVVDMAMSSEIKHAPSSILILKAEKHFSQR